MVEEVRRQFREIPGIMDGTGKPEYDKCVAISTQAAIRQMILPGALAILTPVLFGFGLKGVFEDASSAEILGGLLAGVTVSGVLLAIFQSNAGGAWDNAKNLSKKALILTEPLTTKALMPTRLQLQAILLVIHLKILQVQV